MQTRGFAPGRYEDALSALCNLTGCGKSAWYLLRSSCWFDPGSMGRRPAP